jgi:hypothetical protein
MPGTGTVIAGGLMSVEAYFPEQTLLRLPEGTLAKVRAAAKAEGKTSAEWMRQALRRALLESAAGGARWTVEAHHDTPQYPHHGPVRWDDS